MSLAVAVSRARVQEKAEQWWAEADSIVERNHILLLCTKGCL